MDDFKLIIDFHKHNKRQGPGSKETTHKAFRATSITPSKELKILDVGCGTGTQSLTLAEISQGHVTAVDLFQDFLDRLPTHPNLEGVCASMDDLPFDKESFDLIWSEGAIYNMGFKKGVSYLKQFLKPGGVLAVSEISWITATRPTELEEYWVSEYSEIDRDINKQRILELDGFSPMSMFTIPESDWLDSYYGPMVDAFPAFLEKHKDNPDATAFVEGEKEEISFYKKYKDYYGYVFYIAKKL